jgi:hypothetical protein
VLGSLGMAYFLRLWGFSVALLMFGCSTDSGSDAKSPPGNADAGAGGGGAGADAATPKDSGGTPVDPFTGDCTTARWAGVSDECWSCFCNRCKDTLNACNEGCAKGIACGAERHALVGVASEIQCELRAFAAECASDPVIAAEVTPLTNFDTCLIASHKAPESLRACEKECSLTYTGDVCARYPAPDGG